MRAQRSEVVNRVVTLPRQHQFLFQPDMLIMEDEYRNTRITNTSAESPIAPSFALMSGEVRLSGRR